MDSREFGRISALALAGGGLAPCGKVRPVSNNFGVMTAATGARQIQLGMKVIIF